MTPTDVPALVRQQLLVLGGDSLDPDMVDELVSDLVDRFNDHRGAGLSDEQARERILTELADTGLVDRLRRERAPGMRRPPSPPPLALRGTVLDGLAQDIRYAIRVLRGSPGFLVAAVLTLALGIGALSAIAAVVQAVLLKPVPYPDADRLMAVWEADRDSGTVHEPASVPDFIDLRRQSRRLEALGGFIPDEATLERAPGNPIRVATLDVTAGLLTLLVVQPLAGRLFTDDEYRNGAASVVISERVWNREFQRDPAAIGRVLRMDDRPWTIVGVAPDSADIGILQWLSAADYGRGFADRDVRSRVDAWIPLSLDPQALPRDTHPLLVVGRATAGATATTVQEEASAIMTGLEHAYPENKARGVRVEPLERVIFGPVRPALRVLLVAVMLVLLLATANVANLALVRGRARLRDAAVRSALGASSARLIRQLVIEHVLVGLVAAAAGGLVAVGTLRLLVAIAPADVPRLSQAGIDGSLVTAAFLVSAAIGVLLGLVSAMQLRRLDLTTALSEDGGRSGTESRRARSTRRVLVAVEVALAVMLTVGAGLMIRTLSRLGSVNPGFVSDGVLKVEFQLPPGRYPRNFKTWPDFVEMRRFNDALLEDVSRLPGVEGAALAGNHPLDAGFTNSFTVVGREAEARHWPEISVRRVTPGYFRALGVPLVRGRLFGSADGATTSAVLLVNEAAARRFFENRDPLGQQINFWGTSRRIIGIVGDERIHGVSEAAPPAVYAPLAQTPSMSGSEVLLVRAGTDALALANPIRAQIAALDPGLGAFGVEELRATLEESLGKRRFVMLLLTLFAGVAIALAAIGIHGVLSYDVALRRREFGIRLALGARPSDVVRDVLTRSARTTLVGLVAGGLGALGVTRLLSSLLFGVAPDDGWSFLAATVVLAVVAVAASLAPARRAISMDPSATLRDS